jgi:hypothetical protein
MKRKEKKKHPVFFSPHLDEVLVVAHDQRLRVHEVGREHLEEREWKMEEK